MRRLFLFVLALVIAGVAVPAARAADDAAEVTIGFLPATTRQEHVMIRGTAPREMTVAITVNGELQQRVIAGPGMSVYHVDIALLPGTNHVVAALEGTGARAEAEIFRTTSRFADLASHPYAGDIEMLADLGIVNGIGNGDFGPDLSLTRAQFAKLVVLGLGLKPAAGAALTFRDAAAIPDWARGYVATAVAAGLIQGFDDGTFGPGEAVSRAQVAVIGARALRRKGVAGGEAASGSFRDAAVIPTWAKADVAYTLSVGLVGEFWGDSFAPDQPATRGLAAAVIRRLYTAGR